MGELKALPTTQTDPRQALLQALEHADEMECVAIVYLPKDSDLPLLTFSSMKPMELNFFGSALQHFAFQEIGEG